MGPADRHGDGNRVRDSDRGADPHVWRRHAADSKLDGNGPLGSRYQAADPNRDRYAALAQHAGGPCISRGAQVRERAQSRGAVEVDPCPRRLCGGGADREPDTCAEAGAWLCPMDDVHELARAGKRRWLLDTVVCGAGEAAGKARRTAPRHGDGLSRACRHAQCAEPHDAQQSRPPLWCTRVRSAGRCKLCRDVWRVCASIECGGAHSACFYAVPRVDGQGIDVPTTAPSSSGRRLPKDAVARPGRVVQCRTDCASDVCGATRP